MTDLQHNHIFVGMSTLYYAKKFQRSSTIIDQPFLGPQSIFRHTQAWFSNWNTNDHLSSFVICNTFTDLSASTNMLSGVSIQPSHILIQQSCAIGKPIFLHEHLHYLKRNIDVLTFWRISNFQLGYWLVTTNKVNNFIHGLLSMDLDSSVIYNTFTDVLYSHTCFLRGVPTRRPSGSSVSCKKYTNLVACT